MAVPGAWPAMAIAGVLRDREEILVWGTHGNAERGACGQAACRGTRIEA